MNIVHNFEGRGIYYPSLGFDGIITIDDKHGGSTGDALFYLVTDAQSVGHRYYIVFRWAKPGRWLNEVTGQTDDKFPGDLIDTTVFDVAPGFQMRLRTKIVHHTSSDISAASPGFIDSADLASLSAHMSDTCVGYGTKDAGHRGHWADYHIRRGDHPGVRRVDWVKCERAIADPYGWQRNVQSARSLPWSRVKQLYR
jgi:hypothetical protein